MEQYIYGLLAVFLGAGAVFGHYYYRDFFASDENPAEWMMLYAGLGVSALTMIGYAVVEGTGLDLQNVLLIGRVLGAALVLVSGFVFWHKFRL